jgi:type I restriction enzyme M protein
MMVDILDPKPREYIIDPACGSGGFLIVALQHIWKQLEDDARQLGWSDERFGRTMSEVATRYFRGIDKDSFLAKVTKAYMAIVGDGRGGIFCENTLKPPEEWSYKAQDKIRMEMFDIVVTNPPHGSKIQVRGDTILSQFELAHSWKRDKSTHQWADMGKVKDRQPPQILFIERCLQLLKPGGRMGIILPESLFGNPTYGYIPTYLLRKAKLIAIVSMPEELFQPYTHNKTCVAFLEKIMAETDYPIFMGICKWCGHDSRGNPIPYDEIPQIAPNFLRLRRGILQKFNRLGFIKRLSELTNNIFIPKYYDPDIIAELEALRQSHELVTIGDLLARKVISVITGNEVGKLSYGTGVVPFIRTSDMSNWELKIDPKHGVDRAIYEKYRQRQDIREHDILMVRDGTYLVGTTCMITKSDPEILFQSHIYRIRVLKPEVISPFMLLALLNAPIVKKQVKAKQFTHNIIDTLGSRITELVLPVPKDKDIRQKIIGETRLIVEQRATLRQKAKDVCLSIGMKALPTKEEEELISSS